MNKKIGVDSQKKLSMSPSAVHKRKYAYKCLTLRFADDEHHQIVSDAAKASKLTVNAWLIRVTVEAARRQLKG